MSRRYTLRYLPLFERDLAEARDYIALTLENPDAALRLLEDTERVIIDRLENPLAFEPYKSIKDRDYPYYRIRVRNFTIFYVVIGEIMEVRRFIYGRRNLAGLI